MDEFIEKRIGQTLRGWRLQNLLGVGGMAAVYAATNSDAAEAAVKILHPEIGMRPELRDRFMREGYVANRIEHSGVVRVFEHGAVDDWSVFLVMERLHGESLGARVSRMGTLALPELLQVLDEVLDVLAVAHAAGIVHRDLKPDNLFMTTNGVVKVLDFGIARVVESTPQDVRTRTGMTMGTLPYMAPEQALGRRAEIDGRVDIFALGATAFRILTKRYIHEADTDAGMLVAMASQAAPPLRAVAPEMPEDVGSVVDLALAFSREARYPDARTMQTDVRALRRGEAPPFASACRRASTEVTRPGTRVPALLPAGFTGATAEMPAAAARTAVAAYGAPTVAASVQSVHGAPTVVACAPNLAKPTVVAPVTESRDLRSGRPEPRVPAWLLATGAAALLAGAMGWGLWPGSDATRQASEDSANLETTNSVPTLERPPARANVTRQQGPLRPERTKQQEKARELQKKLEERVREQSKKEAERRRDGHKR